MRNRDVQRWAQRHARALSVVSLTTAGAFAVIALTLVLVHSSTLVPANAGDSPGHRHEPTPALEPNFRRTTPEMAVPTPTPVVVPPSAQPTDDSADESGGDEQFAVDDPASDAPPAVEQEPTVPGSHSQPRSTAPQQPPPAPETGEPDPEPVLPTGEGVLGV